MNILDALKIFYREDTISDFLINCFKDSDEFLIRFLKEVNIQVGEDSSFYIDTRVGLGENIGTPDIVIRAQTNQNMKFIIVENKMGAAEGHEQTNRYESLEARTRIAKKYNVSLENIEFHFIFLALDTTVRPKIHSLLF
ncbi:PD-(D/E)XK nuclease family protein [Heyndrickxia sporothermodurans]